jgi:hypothetical protein
MTQKPVPHSPSVLQGCRSHAPAAPQTKCTGHAPHGIGTQWCVAVQVWPSRQSLALAQPGMQSRPPQQAVSSQIMVLAPPLA